MPEQRAQRESIAAGTVPGRTRRADGRRTLRAGARRTLWVGFLGRLAYDAATRLQEDLRARLASGEGFEHLLLLGQTQELVVESGISTTAAAAQAERAG